MTLSPLFGSFARAARVGSVVLAVYGVFPAGAFLRPAWAGAQPTVRLEHERAASAGDCPETPELVPERSPKGMEAFTGLAGSMGETVSVTDATDACSTSGTPLEVLLL